ncbi:hypothetical protein U725_02829 [Lactococcus cremoris subsp. cremoris GE214]|uniref:Uncharacterized protein n=1 Tax=Lactococcus cremoris subsp. cremoris GE214 TaxID=1415168 RepID=A0A084A6W0_LACLC|nr:hypothetical protein U725_02829 [Lactococcus cremoris subsp. cremoris GE214]
MNLNISQHSPKGSKNNQGENACVKRLVAIHYKHIPLVLFSAFRINQCLEMLRLRLYSKPQILGVQKI